MTDPKGFDELFEQEISKHDTYEEAYLALEAEYQQVFSKPRYTSYESYRIARRQRIKKVK